MTQGVNSVSASGSGKNVKTGRSEEITVKSGENLSNIAKRFGMNTKAFMEWTGLKSSNIQAGQKIKLPTAKVPEGKGIIALARTYGMTLDEFCKLNNISKTYSPAKGEVFYVKRKTEKPVETTETTEKTKKPKQKPTPVTKKTVQPAVTPAAKNKAEYGSSYTPAELGQQIFKKSGEYYGAVGKPDFDALVNEINPKNASSVIKEYLNNPNNKGKESLINTITSEVRSDKTKRKAAVMKVYDALAKEMGTPDSIRESFVKELDKEFDGYGMVDTDKLDETMKRMMATPKELAAKMEHEISHKFPAVGKESFNELISLVDSKNVSEVIKAYNDLKTGESLLEGITSEIGSSKEDRKKAVMHIYNALETAKGANSERSAEFKKELDDQFNSFGMVDTKKLDEIVNKMLETKIQPQPKKSKSGQISKDNSQLTTVRDKSGNLCTSAQLQQWAIASAKKDKGFSKVKNPYIERPLPNLDANGKIEASAEIKQPTNPSGPMKGKIVFVNPGHGGYRFDNGSFDSGTVLSVKNAEGNHMPIEEWKVAKSYAEDLTAKLQAKGATVIVVQGFVGDKNSGKGGMSEDKYLQRLLQGQKGSTEIKTLIRNTKKSDMAFISLHVESTVVPSSQKLCTVRANDSGDSALADKVISNVAKNIPILVPAKKFNKYYVHRAMGNEVPAVLIEIGNIQSQSIKNSLLSKTDRDKYTTALAQALEQTLVK